MIQANRSDLSNRPPSFSEEAVEEFGQITHDFLSKYLKPEEILSVEVVIQWNPQGKTVAIEKDAAVELQRVLASTPRANRKVGRRPVLGTNCAWGPDEGCGSS